MIRCRDGSLYTGITLDVPRRLEEHSRSGARSARRLRGRGPLTLVLSREIGARSLALRLEQAVKKLSKTEKERLIAAPERLADLQKAL